MSDRGDLAAFRRGRNHDRERRNAPAPSGAPEVDVDSAIEQLRATRSAPPSTVSVPSAPPPPADTPTRLSAPPAPTSTTEATVELGDPEAPTPADPIHETPRVAEGPETARAQVAAAKRVRRPGVYLVSPEVVRGLRLLRATRDMDYPELITAALREASEKVPPASDAVRKRKRFRGEKITVELDEETKAAIKAAAEARNLNASAFVTALLEAWMPRRALRGVGDL
jgi:hypothetical protein